MLITEGHISRLMKNSINVGWFSKLNYSHKRLIFQPKACCNELNAVTHSQFITCLARKAKSSDNKPCFKKQLLLDGREH